MRAWEAGGGSYGLRLLMSDGVVCHVVHCTDADAHKYLEHCATQCLCCNTHIIAHHIVSSHHITYTSHHDSSTKTRQATLTHGCRTLERHDRTHSCSTCHTLVSPHHETRTAQVETSTHVHRYVCMYVCMITSHVCVGTHGGRRHARFNNAVQSLIEYHAWQVVRYDPK